MKYFTASGDTEETNKKFAESLELDYPILSDPKKTAIKALGVKGRWTYYVDKEGKIAFIDKRVSARKDGENVAKKLAELKVAKAKPKKDKDEKKDTN